MREKKDQKKKTNKMKRTQKRRDFLSKKQEVYSKMLRMCYLCLGVNEIEVLAFLKSAST